MPRINSSTLRAGERGAVMDHAAWRQDINAIVLGCGSIGRRHIKNLLAVNIGRVVAYDINPGRLAEVGNGLRVETSGDLDEALKGNKFEVGFICSPPSFHVPQALKLLDRGVHCFIEKPLSSGLEGIEELRSLASSRKKMVVIGYPTRFSRMFRKVENMIRDGAVGRVLFIKASVGYYLPFWRPNEDYRQGYASKRELGGGIVLDASHEIDYVRGLAGEVEEVFAVCKKLSDMEIDTEDFAEITMVHKGGVYSQIHLDYLQTNYRRNCEIVGDKGMILWDVNERVIRHSGLRDKEYHAYYEGLNANVNDMYVEEMEHFLRCVKNDEKPFVGIDEGARIQEIIMRVKESSERKQVLSV